MARAAALWAEPLAAHPPGTRTAFTWIPRPQAVALDLAIQAAGLVSDPSGGLGVADLPAPDELEWELPDRPAGGVVAETREISQEELIAAAERIQGVVGQGQGREIVVAGRSPERWADRALLSWATVYGAAVLLADPASLVSSAVWARPTLFQGTAAELSALRRAVEQEKPRFRRLRTVLVSGVEEPSPGDVSFWKERGVTVGGLGEE